MNQGIDHYKERNLMPPEDHDYFCSDLGRENGAALIGTATWGDVWFLLEHVGRWGYKAFGESNLHKEVKEYLSAIRQSEHRVRVQLVKQPASSERQGVYFFIAQISELDPRLYEFQLNSYEDLLDLDLLTYAAGEAGDSAHLRPEPLFLGCVNGKRDKCCARYGLAAQKSMVKVAGDDVWQSTHIGGHRYAPNLLFFPHGVNYGRATPEETKVLVQAYQMGEIVLHNYRGRVCYPAPVNAAEYFWRAETGQRKLPGLRLEELAESGLDRWRVRFTSMPDGDTHSLEVERRHSEHTTFVSCRGDKQKPETWFHRLA
jgi:hypothetical protein